jgi:hypothetical protein
LREARAAGLRPRAPTLHLASAALLVWLVVHTLGSRAPAWLDARLAAALDGSAPEVGVRLVPTLGPALDPVVVGAISIAVLVGGAALVRMAAGRRVSPRALGVSPSIGEIPAWLSLASCVAALGLLGAWLRPALAGAARSVDAPGPGALAAVWGAWLSRGLLALALVAAAVGVIERLVSARRLWQGLHLTRAQARERARASGETRR